MNELTKCRVCGAKPLVGHYGLCESCHDATLRFWVIRRRNIERRRVAS